MDVEVTSMNEPDPSWRFVDAAGHEHRWAGDWRNGTLPTLTLVIDHEHDDDCGDYCPPTSHYECSICGQRVVPGTHPSPERRFVPGLQERAHFIREVRMTEPMHGFYRVVVDGETKHEGEDRAKAERERDDWMRIMMAQTGSL